VSGLALLEARDLSVRYLPPASWFRQPVATEVLRGVNLQLARGERLAVVGESGSGKSTLVRALLRLVRPSRGQALIAGSDLAILSSAELRAHRRRVSLVFQDPIASLNPAMPVQRIVAEPLLAGTTGISAKARQQQVVTQLQAVGLGSEFLLRRPHELSGGQAQRVALARALIASPEVLICDEPVSALDMSLRAQVLALLADQCRQRSLALLFVTHDLAAARLLCDRVLVLCQGEVVEVATTAALFASPQHAYTRSLLGSMLTVDPVAVRGSDSSS
jgi:ABC-type glutathione transport system ATPase component